MNKTVKEINKTTTGDQMKETKKQIKIKVADLIGSPLCISAEDGQKVFGKVEQLVKNGKQVTISFENVTMLISLFLNVAIGQLYGSFSEESIRAQLKVEGLSSDDMELLKLVVDNAKRYYSNKRARTMASPLHSARG